MLRIAFFTLAAACALGALCHGEDRLAQRGTVHFVPTADEAQIAERFRMKEGAFDWQAVRMRTVTEHLEVWDVTFPSPVLTPHPANNTVHCEYFQPRCPGRRPAVIVLHILGGDFPLSRLFCNALAQHGVAALFVKMPYYGPRRAQGTSRRMISENPHEIVDGMTQAILDIRRATAWLAARPEVDDRELGIFGISLGGITSCLAAGNEPRLQNVCTLLAGGDISRVAWDSPELEGVRERWLARGGKQEEFVSALQKIDPVTYAAGARGKRILMLNAADDELIPRACTESLWRALGEPEIRYFSGGHYTVMRHIVSALDRVSRFFASTAGASEIHEIARASEPIFVDGKLEEAVWRDAEPIRVDRQHGRAGLVAEEPPMIARLAWDEHYLYLGYEVHDTDLIARGAVNPDQAMFLISLGSQTEFWEISHAAGNQFSHCWCRVPPASELRNKPLQVSDVQCDRDRQISDRGDLTVARAVHLLTKADDKPSTVNDSSDTDAGLAAEIRLPWAGLQLPVARRRSDGSYRLADLELQVLAALRSGNDYQTQGWSSGELPKQMFQFSANRWPRYILTAP